MKTIKMKPKVKAFNPAANIKSITEFSSTLNETVAGKVLKKIPVDKIRSLPQVRTVFENIDELANSMKEGQLSPITVAAEDDGTYVILQGERRWLAAQKANLKDIEAIVTQRPKDASERIFGQLTENIQRDNMRLQDLIESIDQLVKAGFNQTEIAKRLGKDRTYVSRLAALSKSNDLVKELILEGSVNDAQTAQILNVIAAKSEKAAALFNNLKDENGIIGRPAAAALLAKLESAENKEPDEAKKKKVKAFEDSIRSRDIPKGFHKLAVSKPVQIQITYKEHGKVCKGFLLPRLIASEPGYVCVLNANMKVQAVRACDIHLTGIEALG